MILVAVAAVALTWVMWTRRPWPSPVSGAVSYNGQPVGTGQIVFVPRNPAGQQATSPIIDGRYSLTTFAPNDGAISGSYDIVIVSPSVPVKFRSSSTSGLTAVIRQGANTIDLDLR
jgi:hypothetical protein